MEIAFTKNETQALSNFWRFYVIFETNLRTNMEAFWELQLLSAYLLFKSQKYNVTKERWLETRNTLNLFQIREFNIKIDFKLGCK